MYRNHINWVNLLQMCSGSLKKLKIMASCSGLMHFDAWNFNFPQLTTLIIDLCGFTKSHIIFACILNRCSDSISYLDVILSNRMINITIENTLSKLKTLKWTEIYHNLTDESNNNLKEVLKKSSKTLVSFELKGKNFCNLVEEKLKFKNLKDLQIQTNNFGVIDAFSDCQLQSLSLSSDNNGIANIQNLDNFLTNNASTLKHLNLGMFNYIEQSSICTDFVALKSLTLSFFYKTIDEFSFIISKCPNLFELRLYNAEANLVNSFNFGKLSNLQILFIQPMLVGREKEIFLKKYPCLSVIAA